MGCVSPSTLYNALTPVGKDTHAPLPIHCCICVVTGRGLPGRPPLPPAVNPLLVPAEESRLRPESFVFQCAQAWYDVTPPGLLAIGLHALIALIISKTLADVPTLLVLGA